MSARVQLSDNFTLRELCWSSTAARDPQLLDQQLNPPAPVIQSLGYLTQTVLQPLRDELDWPIRINSGYRCSDLNSLIRGSSTSQHVRGEAADVEIVSPTRFMASEETAEIRALCQMLYWKRTAKRFPRSYNANFYIFVMIALGLEEWDVDQVIHEYGDSWGQPGWVHVATSQRQDKRRVTVVGHYTGGYKHYEAISDASAQWQEAA